MRLPSSSRRLVRLSTLGAILLGLCSTRARAEAALAPLPRELARIAAYGGAGYANEHDSDGMYGAGAVQVSAFPQRSLSASLLVEMISNYDRTYTSRLPAADGEGLLQFATSEKLRRGRLQVGYELLHHLALADSDRVQLSPYVFGDMLAFVNDVWPQRALAAGAGLACEVRVHEALRLFADLSFGSVLHVSDQQLGQRLLYGGIASTFRMAFGAAFAIHPGARFELRYQGEVLQYDAASRILDTLLFGPVFHLR